MRHRLTSSLVAAFTAGITACSFRSPPPAEVPPSSAVAVLRPVLPGRGGPSESLALGMFPEALRIGFDRLAEGLGQCAAERRVLIVPDAKGFPLDGWDLLAAHLDAGHAVLFVGCDPLAARAKWADGRAVTESEVFRELAGAAVSLEGVSSIQGWTHLCSTGLPGTVRVARDAALPWPAVTVEVKALDLWDALVLDPVPVRVIPETANAMALYVRGGRATSRIILEGEEDDGSRWHVPLAVSDPWACRVLREEQFVHLGGGDGRGGDGDHVVFSRLRKLSAGMSAVIAPQAPADHSFGVSDVRFAADPRTAEEALGWPDLFLVSPPYRRHELRASEVVSLASGRRFPVAGARLQAALPRATGTGGEAAAPYRWVPLFEARNDRDEPVGWPASLYFEPRDAAPARRWGWIGVEPSAAARDAVAEMLAEAVGRLSSGIFLHHAGLPKHGVSTGELIRVTVRSTWDTNDAPALKVAAELIDNTGRRLPRRSVAWCSAPGAKTELNLGHAPEVSEAADYTIRFTLEDAKTPDRLYDRLDQRIAVLPAPRPPALRDWVTTAGGRFRLRGRPLFLLGVNYWPRHTNGRMPGEHNPHWLDPAAYAPALVEADLKRLAEVGINAASIQYHEEDQAPQLRHFVELARRHGIWVHAFMSHLQPLDQDLDQAERLFRAAGLAYEPRVFAVDVAWEPHLGPYESRRGLDGAWRAWLIEQYGSIGHAERVIGRRLWRRRGEVTGPPDEELRTDGPHRVAVAIYRRFVDDYMSRRYGEVVRSIRRWGGRQLIGARTGYGGTGNSWPDERFPIDPAAGAVHFDFISPEGWGLYGRPEQFLGAAFITAYCRGVGDGKPVVWIEFGSSVGAEPQAPDLETQAGVYRAMFDMVFRSRAAGCFGWWYPGGWRVGERSDFGVVNPDGTWRPVGDVYRRAAHRSRSERRPPDPWRGREVDRSADARGLSALWKAWRLTYEQEAAAGRIEEVRPAGFGKRTGEIEPEAVGGVPFADPAPMEHVNAEWGRVEVAGAEVPRRPGEAVKVVQRQALKLELINTGATTWDASKEDRTRSVWVRCAREGGGEQRLRIGGVRFGERVVVPWTATDPGRWSVRPLLHGAGGFGERLDILVSEAPADTSPLDP